MFQRKNLQKNYIVIWRKEDVEIATPKKRYISSEERKQIAEELRLVPKKNVCFEKLLLN